MEKLHRFKLVDGKFSPADASQVLQTLINSKINFHNMEVFSLKERMTGDPSPHVKRIGQLKEARDYVDSILKFAKEEGKNLKLEGTIKITLLK